MLLTLNRASRVVTYDLSRRSIGRVVGRGRRSGCFSSSGWPVRSNRRRPLSCAGVTQAAVSNLAKSLIDADLLTRTPADRDGRSVRLALTDAGRRRMRALFQEQSDREQAWVGALTTAEQHILVMLLNKLIADRTSSMRPRS